MDMIRCQKEVEVDQAKSAQLQSVRTAQTTITQLIRHRQAHSFVTSRWETNTITYPGTQTNITPFTPSSGIRGDDWLTDHNRREERESFRQQGDLLRELSHPAVPLGEQGFRGVKVDRLELHHDVRVLLAIADVAEDLDERQEKYNDVNRRKRPTPMGATR